MDRSGAATDGPNHAVGQGLHAVEQLEGLARGAADRGLELALAVAAGLLLARAMRARHLHWAWGATALAALAVLRAPVGPAWPTLALAATAATLRVRRWHREDLAAGSDLAAAARGRLTPASGLRLAAQALRSKLPEHDAAARRRRSARIGLDRSGRPVCVPFGEGAGGHALVVGATGSGKTVTQTLLAVRAIEGGLSVIVIDPKGDRAMRDALRDAAADGGREFLEWSPSGPSAYNPYARGGETEIADRLLAGERFTEPHYLRQAQRYLGHTVRALRAGGREVSLRSIVAMLEPAALEQALRGLPEPEAAAGHAYLDSLTPRQGRDLAGVRDRLAILTESDVGRWLAPAEEGRPQVELLEAARSGAVVYFNLEADSRPLLAKMLGAAVVQDLQSTVAALQGAPAPTLVVIDEFSALAAEQVVALFGRARSAGMALLLGTQELSDLRLPGRERLLEQVLGNLSLLIAHRQVVPASAELVSRLAGERGCWRTTWSSDGRTSRSRSHEPVLAPGRLMGLAPGWGVVIPFGSSAGARLARIIPAAGSRR